MSEAQDFPAFSTIFTLVGIPGGLIGIICFRLISKINIHQVRIYENGVFSNDKDGEHTAKWTEIENLGVAIIRHRIYGVIVKRSFNLTITKTNREGFIITSLIKNAEEIGKRLIYEADTRSIPVYKGSQSPEYYEQMFH